MKILLDRPDPRRRHRPRCDRRRLGGAGNGCQALRLCPDGNRVPLVLRYYQGNRPHDACRRHRDLAGLRCHPSRRRRLAGGGAGFRLAARPAAADPQGLRAIRQHPPAPAAAGRSGSAAGRGLRHPLHPREHRRRIFRRRRARASGHDGRGRGRDLDLHPHGRRAHPALRLRAGAVASRQARLGHQVQRAEILDGVLGRDHARSWPRIIPMSK